MNASFTSNARQIADRQRRRARQVQEATARAAMAHGQALQSKARALSGGRSVAQRQAARLSGLPAFGVYSARLPARMPFDALIGRKSGVLAASWRLTARSSGGVSTLTLTNSSREWRFMAGTRWMRARPLLAEAERQVGPAWPGFVKAVRAAERDV